MEATCRNLLIFKTFVIMAAGVALISAEAGQAADDPVNRLVLEGGLLQPRGDLGADFDETFLGLGADTGYEAGFRFRLPMTPAFSISPGFHFVDFQSHVLTDAAEQEFKTEALSYRFTLEFMLMPHCEGASARPFLAVAGGLYRNRVVGFYDDPTAEERNSSVNSFGYSVRGGFAVGNYEVSFVAHRNRVETLQFFQTESRESYCWNNMGVRVGYLLPL